MRANLNGHTENSETENQTGYGTTSGAAPRRISRDVDRHNPQKFPANALNLGRWTGDNRADDQPAPPAHFGDGDDPICRRSGGSRWLSRSDGLHRALVSTRTAEPDFDQVVRPFLTSYCLDCHGDRKQEGKLDLRAEMSGRVGLEESRAGTA